MHVSTAFSFFLGLTALFMGPLNSAKYAYPYIFESHNTIYTFKNYFTTVSSIINFQFSANKWYPNRDLIYTSNTTDKKNHHYKLKFYHIYKKIKK